MFYYNILNTQNNKAQGLSYGYTDEKPGETVDFVEKYLVNGVEYSTSTPPEVVRIIENCRLSNKAYRLTFQWGDTKTGQDWGDVYDISGYIGKSTGKRPIPLLIHKRTSTGGGALLENSIVKISMAKGGKVLWQHPTYKAPKA